MPKPMIAEAEDALARRDRVMRKLIRAAGPCTLASRRQRDHFGALVRGIGRWTAEMFLMFQLGRMDVWPVDDYGVRKGYALAYEMPELPKPKELELLGTRFRPHRSVAAWYCWRAVDTLTPGS